MHFIEKAYSIKHKAVKKNIKVFSSQLRYVLIRTPHLPYYQLSGTAHPFTAVGGDAGSVKIHAC